MDPSLAPAGTFVSANAYDPLRHNSTDFFWFHIEPFFRPFEHDDIATLNELTPKAHEQVDAPLAQRMVAALLDEGKGASVAARALRTTPAIEPMWLPGALPSLRAHNRVFDSRLRAELERVGLFRPHDAESADTARLRLDAWHLRNLSAINADTVRHVTTQVSAGIKSQAARRELKRKHDLVEVEYIKKMMDTNSKRHKSRFSKLLRDFHPYHDLSVGAPIPGSQANGDASTANGNDRKKKKRKSTHERHKSSKHDANKLERAAKNADNRSISAGYNA